MLLIFPPIFSICILADAEILHSSIFRFFTCRLPWPKIFTPALILSTNPALRNVFGLTVPPSLKQRLISLIFTTANLGNNEAAPRDFGKCLARCKPKAGRRLPPERDFWPLTPRVLYVPWPEALPRPSRFFFLRDSDFRECKFKVIIHCHSRR